MKFLPLLAPLPLLLAAQAALASPTQSSIRVQTIYMREADGSRGVIPRIQVWEGYGFNISFMKTGTVVKRIWLDNPNRFSLDVDGYLCDDARSDCEGDGASVVHLRLAEDINLPHLTQSATQSTLLTAIAEGSGGQRTLYQFELSPARGTPLYAALILQPNPPTLAPAPRPSLVREPLELLAEGHPEEFARQVALGLERAERTDAIGAKEAKRVRKALKLLDRGSRLPEAALAAEMPEARLLQLARLGTEPEPTPKVEPEPQPDPIEATGASIEPEPEPAARSEGKTAEPEPPTETEAENMASLLQRYERGDLDAIARLRPSTFGLKLILGLEKARQEGAVDPAEADKVRTALAQLNQGTSFLDAARSSGVAAERLVEIAGYGSPAAER